MFLIVVYSHAHGRKAGENYIPNNSTVLFVCLFCLILFCFVLRGAVWLFSLISLLCWLRFTSAAWGGGRGGRDQISPFDPGSDGILCTYVLFVYFSFFFISFFLFSFFFLSFFLFVCLSVFLSLFRYSFLSLFPCWFVSLLICLFPSFLFCFFLFFCMGWGAAC